MKTILRVEIETEDSLPVLFEEGDVESEYDAQKLKELPKFQKDYAKRVHEALVKDIKRDLNGELQEGWLEEEYVESWDQLKDYKTTIKWKEVK